MRKIIDSARWVGLLVLAVSACSTPSNVPAIYQASTPAQCSNVGLALCGTDCVNLFTDAANCGACGNQCPSGMTCASAETPPSGHDTDEGNSFSVTNFWLYGQPVTIAADITLTGYGLFPRATGGNVRIGLYTDSAGAPGALIAKTKASSTLTAGTLTIVSTAPVAVAAGSYWLAIITDTAGGLGAGTTATQTAQRKFTSFAQLPANFVNASTTVTSNSHDLDISITAAPRGACGETCAPGYASCGTYCANLQVDANHCGSCGAACPLGQQCAGGMCSCPTTTPLACGSDVNAFCTNPATDPTNCGACGNLCPSGTLCSMGVCAESCAAGFTACENAYCADLQNDANNCGACNQPCTAGQQCTNGTCTTPLNDCLTNNGGCAANAVCTNTPGGHTCSCPPDYTGDGYGSCVFSLCLSNPPTCDPHASCVKGPNDAPVCACSPGYDGDGTTCDENECITVAYACSPYATCTNTPGSYSCLCPPGFTGDGRFAWGCVDINECLIANGGCSTFPLATCHNIPGGRTCTCPAGTTGDGIICH